MKLAVIVLIAVIAFAIATGMIVIHHQNNRTCVSYYNKDGSHVLYKDCK